MFRLPSLAIATCLGFAFLQQSVQVAFGVSVSPGDQNVAVETISAVDPTLAGTTLLQEVVNPESTIPVGFPFPVLSAQIIQRADTGTLDFYYNIGSGSAPNATLSINGFAVASTDVYQVLNSFPHLGTAADRSAGLGDTILLASPLGTLQGFLIRSSLTSLPSTQSLTYVEGTDVGIELPSIGNYDVIVSSANLPEPASLGLFGLGFLGLVLRTRSFA